ncbi:hypothetical protein HHK36_020163 [Tetracentron sinense]|uniref:Ubiquitin-like protease family profile domain-containing protein n=1 Tax=Tetracentron sinense TaxID=13715 RepID=A0A835D8K8_TETSI|nr:hypothetical protein HHK36_020163 [Tetracentron sinense]
MRQHGSEDFPSSPPPIPSPEHQPVRKRTASRQIDDLQASKGNVPMVAGECEDEVNNSSYFIHACTVVVGDQMECDPKVPTRPTTQHHSGMQQGIPEVHDHTNSDSSKSFCTNHPWDFVPKMFTMLHALDSKVVDAYCKLLKERELSNPSRYVKSHFFSAYFIPIRRAADDEYRHWLIDNPHDPNPGARIVEILGTHSTASVWWTLRWWVTKSPIVSSSLHWVVVIMYFRQRRIQLWDSLGCDRFGSYSTFYKLLTDHIPGAPVVPSSILGMSVYIPPGQVTTLHPFVMHQGVPHSIPSASSNVPQSYVGHFQHIPAIPSHLHWQNQQAVSEGSHISNHNQYQPSQTDNDLLRSGAHYDYKLSVNGQAFPADYLDAHISRGQEPGSVITTSTEEAQVLESNDKRYLIAQQPQQNLQEISSQFHEALRLDPPEQNSETKEQDDNTVTLTNHSQEDQGLTTEQPNSVANTSSSDTPTHLVNFSETTDISEASFSAARESILLTLGKIPEPTLVDERSLLACIVRATPAGSGGRIRISSTLPNRLGKMLAPLHWHDYKKKYGRLDDFVAGHPEVSFHTHRLKKVPVIDSKPVNTVSTEHAIGTMTDACDKPSQLSAMQNQPSNGVCYDIVQGLSNIKMLSKPKDPQELNGLLSETRHIHTSVHMAVGNGSNTDRTGLDNFLNKSFCKRNTLNSMFIQGKIVLDEDRVITGSENGLISLVGILPNRIIQPIEYPVVRPVFLEKFLSERIKVRGKFLRQRVLDVNLHDAVIDMVALEYCLVLMAHQLLPSQVRALS